MASTSTKHTRFLAFSALLALFAAMFVAQPASAAVTFTYTVNSQSEATITGFSGTYTSTFVVPGEIDGHPVVAIGDNAFRDIFLVNDLVISEGIRSIGNQSFKNILVNNFVFPSTLESIGVEGAWVGSILTTVKFKGDAPTCAANCIRLYDPETTVYAYDGAVGFGSTWRGSKVEYLPRWSYTTTNGEVSINEYIGTPDSNLVIPATLGGNPVVAIADQAFANKSLDSVKLPTGLKTIGSSAFMGNNLSEIAIPATVTQIGSYAFAFNPSLAKVTFKGNAPTSGGGLFMFTSPSLTTVFIYYQATGFSPDYEGFNPTEMAPPSSDATLSLLAPEFGTLSPAFDRNVTSYTMSVNGDYTLLRLLLNPEVSASTVTYNGNVATNYAYTEQMYLQIGENSIPIVVTAEDGETTKTYTVVVTRAAPESTDANLSNLVPSAGTLQVNGIYDFTLPVPTTQTAITFTPTARDSHATIAVNGSPVASGTVSQSIDLNVGSNVVEIVVTAQKGNTATYRITVNREAPVVLSNNSKLSGLALESQTLSPAFSQSTLSYTASVPYGTTSVRLKPTVAESHATVKVNGTTVASGSFSTSIPVSPGANSINAVVTAEDGTTSSYTVVVTRAAASSNAKLSALLVDSQTIAPDFAQNTLSYTASVPFATTTVRIKPTVADSTATVKVNGTTVSSGTLSGAIELVQGANTITTVVTAQDGTTKGTYTLVVTRSAANTNANLSALSLNGITLSPVFASGTASYTATVPYSVGSYSVTATTSVSTSTVKVKGANATSGVATSASSLSVGQNAIAIVVTAQSGTTKTYNVTITRTAASSVATLSAFAPGSGAFNETFATATLNYTQKVANSVSKIKVRATSTSDKATVKINGLVVGSGDLSSDINLAVGANTILVDVTAENGSTTKQYKVVITREAPVVLSSDARLKALVIGSDAVSSQELGAWVTKNVKVADTVANIKFTATVNESHATIKINGRTMQSGIASGWFTLARGANTFNVVVTAQNGQTVRTYTVVITRKVLSNDSKLKSLVLETGTLDAAFNANRFTYAVTVPYAKLMLEFTVAANDANATVTVDNNRPNVMGEVAVELETGVNAIQVQVTAESGNKTTYVVNVTRTPASNNAKLKSLAISAGTLSPAFVTSTSLYTTTVSNATNSLTFTATPADTNAIVTINNVLADSKGQVKVNLSVGKNVLYVIVTAQNGIKSNYAVTVTRQTAADKPSIGDVTVSGDTTVGSRVTATVTGVKGSPTPTPSYQWRRCTILIQGSAQKFTKACNIIAGATGSTYVLTKSDVGFYIAVGVIVSNGIDAMDRASATLLSSITE